MSRRVKRRPYRVALIGGGRSRRHSYTTCERAVQAALADAQTDSDLYLTAHRQYVVEHHTAEGPWLPTVAVQVDGGGRVVGRRSYQHMTATAG